MSVIEEYLDQQIPEWRHNYVRLHDHEKLIDSIRSLVHSSSFATECMVSVGEFNRSSFFRDPSDETSLLRRYDRQLWNNYEIDVPETGLSADVSAGINQYSRHVNATIPSVPPAFMKSNSLHSVVLPAALSSPMISNSKKPSAGFPESLQTLEAAYTDQFLDDIESMRQRYDETVGYVKEHLSELLSDCDCFLGESEYGSLENNASLRRSFDNLELPDLNLEVSHSPNSRRTRQYECSEDALLARITALHTLLTKLRLFIDGCTDALEHSLFEHDAASPIKLRANLNMSFGVSLRWCADALACLCVVASRVTSQSLRSASTTLRSHYTPFRSSSEWSSVNMLCGLCLCVFVLMLVMQLLVPDILSNIFINASMPLFRLILVTVAYIAGWAGVVHVCRNQGIKYDKLLDLDYRVLLMPVEQWKLAVSILFVFCLTAFISSCIYVYEWIRSVTPTEEVSGNISLLGAGMEGATIHAWVFVVTLALVCYPGKRFLHHTRFYVFRQIREVVQAPIGKITFSQTFFGDQQCSLTKTSFDQVYAFCFYFSGEFLATSGAQFRNVPNVLMDHHGETQVTSYCRPFVRQFQWILAFVPFQLRAIQCACLYRRERKQKHLWNLGKYSMAMVMTLCAMLYKQQLDAYSSLQKSIFPRKEEGSHQPNPFLKKMSSSLFSIFGGPRASHQLETAYKHMEQEHELQDSTPGDNTGSLMVGSLTTILSNSQILELRTQAAVVDQFWAMFFAMAVAATLFNIVWDLTMDMGFFERGPAFPFRKYSTVPASKRTLVFSAVIIVNIILRCTWVDTLLPTSLGVSVFKSDLSILILSLLEVTRRSIWNIIRLDLEHVEKQKILPKEVYLE